MNSVVVFEAREISRYQYLCVRDIRLSRYGCETVVVFEARVISEYQYLWVRFEILTP